MIKHLILSGAMLVANILPASARELPQAVVHHTDLDLSSEADAVRMLERIEQAAAELCGQGSSIVHPVQLRWIKDCKNQAVSRAVSALGAPLVTAAYRSVPEGAKPERESKASR